MYTLSSNGATSTKILSNDNNKIYKISLDSKENTKVCNDSAETINVSDGWIYYCNNSNPTISPLDEKSFGTLYKIKTDGTGSQNLSNFYPMDINLSHDSVYYHKYFDSGSMRGAIRTKIKKDGSNDISLSEFVENTSSSSTEDTTTTTTTNNNNNTGDAAGNTLAYYAN